MSLSETDLQHLRQCVVLAREASGLADEMRELHRRKHGVA
jgi:hypothetical protein